MFIHYNNIEELILDNAFIVANEIFDAFCCELVFTKDNIRQIGKVKDDKIEFIKCEDEFVNKICDRYDIKKGEISLGFEEFAKTLNKNIKEFNFITFDYGDRYPRNDFSSRVYYQHKVYPLFDKSLDLKKLFAKSDITYDVNFGHLIDAFQENNIEMVFYYTQLKALVEFGIIELLEMVQKHSTQTEYIRETNKIKTLIEPTAMGERFKMVHFYKK